MARVLTAASTAGLLHRAWPARLLLELLPHVPAPGGLDCRWADLVRRTALRLQHPIRRLAVAGEIAPAGGQRNRNRTRLPGDLRFHPGARPPQLCGAHLVAAIRSA